MVYVITNCRDISAQQLAFLERCTDSEMQSLLKRRPGSKLHEGLAAHHGVVCALYEQHGLLPDRYKLSRDLSGKPVLEGVEGLFVSKAHSKGTAAVAVSNSPIGVDIEGYIAYREAFAKKICSQNELNILKQQLDKELFLTRLFCSKEAFGKVSGRGLLGCKEISMTQIDESIFEAEGMFCTTMKIEHMVLAVCSSEANPTVQVITAPQLLDNLLKIGEYRINL